MIVSTIEPLGLIITLPEGMAQQGSANRPMFCFQDSLNTRYPRCFTLAAIDSKPDDDFSDWESLELDTGGKFYYQRELFNVGSGGPEEHLTGYIEIDDRYFKIEASEQQRSGQPDSTWCLSIVQTLRLDTAESVEP